MIQVAKISGDVKRGSTPSTLVMCAAPAHHHAAAIAAADPKGSFFHRGENNHALRLIEQVEQNVATNVQNFFQYGSCFSDTILFVLTIGSEGCRRRHKKNDKTHCEILRDYPRE